VGIFVFMAKNPLHKSGDLYGGIMLTGKSYSMIKSGRKRRFVECICECGNLFFASFDSLRSKYITACGCTKKARIIALNKSRIKKVKKVKHPLYSKWRGIKSRCYNENEIGYKNWGGRGIIVCDEWLYSFSSFYDWAVSNGWQHGLTLDRINNDGNYEPSNCRWVGYDVQSRNTRVNNYITAFGETKCIKDWAEDERCSVGYTAIYYRLNINKWTPEMAISKPSKRKTKWQGST
jgi:hypothetical protein